MTARLGIVAPRVILVVLSVVLGVEIAIGLHVIGGAGDLGVDFVPQCCRVTSDRTS